MKVSTFCEKNNMKILSFGEILWDVFDTSKIIGGAPFNFAAHFVKCGGEAYLLSAVGCDELGDAALERVKHFGVSSKYVLRHCDLPTGKCQVTLDENKVPSYDLVKNSAWDRIDTSFVNEDFDVLYFGTLSLRDEYNKKSLETLLEKRSFSEVFVDVNLRKPFYTPETVGFAVEKATVIKVSDEELSDVAKCLSINGCIDTFPQELCKRFTNIKLVIITKGERGSLAFDPIENKVYNALAHKCECVSTVGAGDSFAAAFLAKYLDGEDINSCLDFASKISARVVSHKEAIPE